MKPVWPGFILALFVIAPASAQTDTARNYATQAAQACLTDWQSPACINTLSTSKLNMAETYSQTLERRGYTNAANLIFRHCHNGGVLDEPQPYPPYAMQSASTQCANAIAHVEGHTGIQPDMGQYQLMIGSVYCMEGDPRCQYVTDTLQTYRDRP